MASRDDMDRETPYNKYALMASLVNSGIIRISLLMSLRKLRKTIRGDKFAAPVFDANAIIALNNRVQTLTL